MGGVKQLYCYKKSWPAARLGGARLKIWIDHFTLPRVTRQLLSWPLDSPRIGGSPLTCPTCCWLGNEFSGRTFCGRYAWSVMLGPKKSISFYRVEGIITKVRYPFSPFNVHLPAWGWSALSFTKPTDFLMGRSMCGRRTFIRLFERLNPPPGFLF